MDILVLGGTAFLSRTVAELAHLHGHNVTAFNRGITGTAVPGIRTVLGDRNDPDSLRQLTDRQYDLVFDTGYTPQEVRTSSEMLEPHVKHYVFTSSISTYPGWPGTPNYQSVGVYDGDPDAVGDQVLDGLAEGSEYGWRKVGAELAVLRSFGERRVSILRAGLIVGRYDDRVGRLPWWLMRISRGGPTLAPGDPADHIRVIDARDLAEFALHQPVGTFETTGPARQITYGQLFDEARAVTGSDAEFHWVSDDALVAAGAEPWHEIPLWLPSKDAPSKFEHDTTAAEAAGLACRPVRDTLADTWEWMQNIPGGWQPFRSTTGLTADREASILASL